MRDYTELVSRLRKRGVNLEEKFSRNAELLSELMQAADAIEELLAAVRSVVRCKECEWWTKQEASIQGRCARLAIYPTGEFYCASGSKPEPPKEDSK